MSEVPPVHARPQSFRMQSHIERLSILHVTKDEEERLSESQIWRSMRRGLSVSEIICPPTNCRGACYVFMLDLQCINSL